VDGQDQYFFRTFCAGRAPPPPKFQIRSFATGHHYAKPAATLLGTFLKTFFELIMRITAVTRFSARWRHLLFLSCFMPSPCPSSWVIVLTSLEGLPPLPDRIRLYDVDDPIDPSGWSPLNVPAPKRRSSIPLTEHSRANRVM